MTYHPYALHLSAAQLHKLAQGQKIRLKAAQLGSGDELPLTTAQVNKCQKAVAAGKGCDLQLSAAQISHLVKSGGGLSDFFKSIPGKVKSVAKDVAVKGIDIAELLATKGVDIGSNIASEFAKGKIDALAGDGKVGQAGNWAVDQGVKIGKDFTKDQISALLSGLKSTVNGRGLFSFTSVGRGLAEGQGLHPPGRGRGLRLPGER